MSKRKGPTTKEGTCALTGKDGRFVKCHILPQALTRPEEKGSPISQSSKGKGPKKRWSSWYDPSLVIREGEDFLSLIDDRAIRAMREHALVWSSWVVCRPNFKQLALGLPEHSFREIEFGESSKDLYLFALSVLWRSAASKLPEMHEIVLNNDLLEQLRAIVIGELELDYKSFPTSIMQVSTVGMRHNMSPLLNKWRSPPVGDVLPKETDIARIYVDGLIFHVHLNGWSNDELNDNPMFLGTSPSTFVNAVTYEASFQYENLMINLYETYLGPSGAPADTQSA